MEKSEDRMGWPPRPAFRGHCHYPDPIDVGPAIQKEYLSLIRLH